MAVPQTALVDATNEKRASVSGSRRRLCIVCSQSPTDMGGIQTVVRDLVRLYSSSGYEVHICSGTSLAHVKGYSHCHSYWIIRKCLTEFIWPLNLLYVLLLTVYLCVLQKRYAFDVLLPQDNYLQGLAAGLAGKITGCPVVIMDHGVVTNVADPRWQEAWKERHGGVSRIAWPFFRVGVLMQPLIFRLACRFGDRFFYTGYELEEFYDAFRVPYGKRWTYEHVIDADFFSPATSADDIQKIKRRFDIPENHFVLSCTSRINFEKGYKEITAAFAQLVDTVGRNVLLVVAGDTGQVYQTRFRADREKLELLRYLQDRGLTPNVRFLGVLDPASIRDLNRASDVHVYAGTMGCSFSLSALEAMACALPCIVTPVPRKQADVFVPEIGWVVPPGQVEPLARAFIEAYTNRARLREMGKRARARVIDHNTYAVMRQTYEEALLF